MLRSFAAAETVWAPPSTQSSVVVLCTRGGGAAFHPYRQCALPHPLFPWHTVWSRKSLNRLNPAAALSFSLHYRITFTTITRLQIARLQLNCLRHKDCLGQMAMGGCPRRTVLVTFVKDLMENCSLAKKCLLVALSHDHQGPGDTILD